MNLPARVSSPAVLSIALLTVTLLVYWQISEHEFIPYDDQIYITENIYIQPGLNAENIAWAFTSGYAANWHPLTWMSHMLDYELFGLNPTGHHLHNLFLHALNALLLFCVFRRMTGSLWQSFFVAAVFALHPLHVESVAWASERKDTLSTLFFILTLWSYHGYTTQPAVRRYIGTLMLFALGLMAKPMLVTLPFILLLLDYWPLNRLSRQTAKQLVIEKIPLFLLSLLSASITYLVQQRGGAIAALGAIPIPLRLINSVVSYVNYIVHALWPVDLAILYPHGSQLLPLWQVLALGVLLGAVTLLFIRLGRHYRYLTVGWLWYLGTLVPVIGIVQVGMQSMADRYMYIPLIGLSMIAAWGVPELMQKWKFHRAFVGGISTAVIAVLAFLTAAQAALWRDGETLFTHTLQVTEKNWVAHHVLGTIYKRRGDFPQAYDHFSQAVTIYPKAFPSHRLLADVLERLGEPEAAIEHYLIALRYIKDTGKIHFELATLLVKQGRSAEGLDHFTAACQADSAFGNPHQLIGLMLIGEGKLEEGIAELTIALEQRPYDATIREDLERARQLRNTEKPFKSAESQ